MPNTNRLRAALDTAPPKTAPATIPTPMERTFVRPGEVVVDGVRSPLIEAGPPDAREAVVFIHGNPGSGLVWYDLLSSAGAVARAVALAAPWVGRGDKPGAFVV